MKSVPAGRKFRFGADIYPGFEPSEGCYRAPFLCRSVPITTRGGVFKVSDSDPLVIEDWSAYEKSMLDVLREERRTRARPAPVERPISPEELRQIVQDKAIEPVPVEPSIGTAAPQAVVLSLFREQSGQVPPSTAHEHKPSSATAIPLSAPVPPFEQQCEPAPKPAVMEVVQDHVSPAAAPVSSTQPAQRDASWWRIPLFLSSLAAAVADGAVALVKPERRVNPETRAVVAEEPFVQKDSSAPVSTVEESAKDQPILSRGPVRSSAKSIRSEQAESM